MRFIRLAALLTVLIAIVTAQAGDGNRLTYLDGNDLYYPSRTFPRLITPQWVGEEGVEAVVILAIDDMRGHEKYEKFLRPILNRLKKIDGRAPVSIMTCQIDPQEPHLQTWLKEGLSLECHTYDHPCPLLRDGDFAKAKGTYDRCVDLLASVPNSRPVAFRTPCCDSLNTPSPRLFAEIFNRVTDKKNFLTLDSSVFNVFTSNDPELPRELVLEADGSDRFRKYVPYDRSFVNTIENYPYPYVIGRLCWEFPCATPSDWQAQYLQKPNNPITVRDWKAALDCTVIKQGVFCMVFHPHGWIQSEQIVDFIDHAATKHSKKVKFLTFKEAEERLNNNLLGFLPLRDPKTGSGTGTELLIPASGDRFTVAIPKKDGPLFLDWFPTKKGGEWREKSREPGGIVGQAIGELLSARFRPQLTRLPSLKDFSIVAEVGLGSRPGQAELFKTAFGIPDGKLARFPWALVVANEREHAVFLWSTDDMNFVRAKFSLPPGARFRSDRDHGVRFVDIDEDGKVDVIFSNEEGYGVYLFKDWETGWSRKVIAGKAGDKNAIPMIAKNGQNMGFFVHSRHLWWQNEHTNLLPNLVDRRSFNQILAETQPTAKSPEASLASMQARPGFKVELMAAEPLVQDPIAFAWGPDGKLWVVEMGDYPLGVDGKGKPGSKIKYLEDTKGTGKYDKATVFLDNLPYATSVMPWRKGVIVTCAPDIFYAEDTKGTGKADVRIPLYSGFVEGNQQHRVNSLAWGLDNWIYLANGDSGGKVKSHKTGVEVDIRGRDCRIRPDTGEIELQSGQTQFGRARDDWGNWFGNNNSNPMWHYALTDHYLRRNPHIAAPDPRVQISVTPGAAQVYPISRTLPRFNSPDAANHFTSACSAIVYRDELFGPHFANNTFVSEPVHNLVHREIMTPKGFTFSSRRAADEMQSEFLASSDNWFRPTTIQTGPDGALWIADMYRHVIEHPQWIPKEWQEKLDLRVGSDKGRLYRVYPVGVQPRPIPRLDKLDTAGLVAALDSPSGWQRDMAQQMLLWRADAAALPLLEKMAAPAERPLARLHALCTLDGLNALKPGVVAKALQDAHPGLRRHAVRVTEGLLKKEPELGTLLVKLVTDDDPQVRMQLAYTLGEWNDPQAGKALGRLALAEHGDRFMLTAILSSINRDNLEAVMLAVLTSDAKTPPPAVLIENLLRLANAFNHSQALVTLLGTIGTADNGKYARWQTSALAGLLDALDQRGISLKQLADGGKPQQEAVQRLAGLFGAARATLANPKAAKEDQLLALRLLGRGLDHQAEDRTALAALLVPQTADDLQAAAIATLARLRDPQVPALLLRGWRAFGPALRTQVLDVLIGREDWLKLALDALEKKELSASEIDAQRRQRILEHKSADIRQRAVKLFAGSVNPDRQKVVDAYQEALTLKGDGKRGAEVFGKHCATCHKLGTVGHEVGPDLASVGDKSPPGLLVAIFDPNRVVEARYVNYTALTKNGQSLSGVLASETGSSITLLGPDGKKQVILRSDLDELVSTGKSAMPEGLEKDIKHQDLADLIAHIQGAVPQPKQRTFAGNNPELVRAEADGSLLLLPKTAEIYGSTLVLEKKYGNLGYWNSDDDHVVWTVQVARAGKYAVWLDWACADNSAGKSFVLQAGQNQLTAKVAGTGSWDTYKTGQVGEILLTPGRHRLTFRPAGRLAASALIDLRGVKLVPLKE